jgi:hypothetical protein
MQEELGLRLMEGLSKRVPLIHPTLSLIFGFICLIIYLAFMLRGRIEDFYLDIYYIKQTILFCALLVYLLIFNRYIINQMKTIVQELNFIPGSEKQEKELNDKLIIIFLNSKNLYIIVSLVIIPFLVSNYVSNVFFSNIFFNIYNYFLYIFMLYLIATALWMILSISLILDSIGTEPYINFIKIDLFNADRIGGLGIARAVIAKIIIYYSVGISLGILSYINPDDDLSTVIGEIIALALLLLAGIILLVWGLENLQKPFRKRMIEDLDKINEEYQYQYKTFTKIMSDNQTEDDKALQSATKRIEALHKERAEREKILNDSGNKYSYSAAIIAAISFIMPVLALFEKMNNYGLIKFILNAFNIKY